MRLGPITVLGESGEAGPGVVRLLPYTHGNAFPWWDPTTRRLLEELTAEDVAGKTVVDFGAGASAILGLAAAALGAMGVVFVERDPELRAIAETQLRANGLEAAVLPALEEGAFDFLLANLGSALEVGELSRSALHGLGTDEAGEVIRW